MRSAVTKKIFLSPKRRFGEAGSVPDDDENFSKSQYVISSTLTTMKIWLSPRSGGAKIQTLSRYILVFGYVIATKERVSKMQKKLNLIGRKKFYGEKRFKILNFHFAITF